MRFCIWGSLNTLAGLAIILTVQAVTNHSYLANTTGFVLGGAWGYRIHARMTFKSQQTSRGMGLYFAVLLSGYGLNITVLHRLLETSNASAAQMAALGAYVAYSYAMNKLFVFPRPDGRP